MILLCTAPKSNSGILAIDAALKDVERRQIRRCARFPEGWPLRRGQRWGTPSATSMPMTSGHYVVQQYPPDAIRDREYYRFGDNKTGTGGPLLTAKNPVDGPVEEEPMQHKMRETLAPRRGEPAVGEGYGRAGLHQRIGRLPLYGGGSLCVPGRGCLLHGLPKGRSSATSPGTPRSALKWMNCWASARRGHCPPAKWAPAMRAPCCGEGFPG